MPRSARGTSSRSMSWTDWRWKIFGCGRIQATAPVHGAVLQCCR